MQGAMDHFPDRPLGAWVASATEGWIGRSLRAIGRFGSPDVRHLPDAGGFGRALESSMGCPEPLSGYPAAISLKPPARWSFRRLWTAQLKRHWARAASSPRRSNRFASWTVCSWPKTGSAIVFLLA